MMTQDDVRVAIKGDTVNFEFVSDEAKQAYRNNKEFFQEELGKAVKKEVEKTLKHKKAQSERPTAD